MLEKMYADFVANVLPKVQEGLVITKDYFFDLFGRYVTYLIVHDSVSLCFDLLFVIGIPVWISKNWEFFKNENEDALPIIFWIWFAVLWLIAFFSTFVDTENLLKSIYIPEVRVYEELQHFKK